MVEAESIIEIRALDINGNATAPVITLTVFSQNGNVADVWGFSTDTPLKDGVSYLKLGGSNLGSTPYSDFIPCLGAKTRIKTQSGAKAAEDIAC